MIENHSHSEPDPEWQIETIEDHGEMFHEDDLYPIPEFLRILRIIINRYLADPDSAAFIKVLEVWEKRVIDLASTQKDNLDQILVGFTMGEDRVTRIYFAAKG